MYLLIHLILILILILIILLIIKPPQESGKQHYYPHFIKEKTDPEKSPETRLILNGKLLLQTNPSNTTVRKRAVCL